MKIITLATTLIMLMTAAKATFPNYLSFLPLGGSIIAETGIILTIFVSLAIFLENFGKS